MAYWNEVDQTIVRFEPTFFDNGWAYVDCGCCAGTKWGGEYPEECNRCGGNGMVFIHLKSGVSSVYPGGQLTGSNDSNYLDHLVSKKKNEVSWKEWTEGDRV